MKRALLAVALALVPLPVAAAFPTPIQHVIVVVQENRSVDNIFNGYCVSTATCADTVKSCTNCDSVGGNHTLQPISLNTVCDPNHGYAANFKTEFAGNWDLATLTCGTAPSLTDGVYAYVQYKDVWPYWALASVYSLADHVFQVNEGPSFPAHQFLIAGQSGGPYSDNAGAFSENPGLNLDQSADAGCGAGAGSTAAIVKYNTGYPAADQAGIFPCRGYNQIFSQLATTTVGSTLTWNYYCQKNNQIWCAVDAISTLNPTSPGSGVGIGTTPAAQFLTDIGNGTLANLTYVTPAIPTSDHPFEKANIAGGPNWVRRVVQAVCNSAFWNTTEIILTWDDWGGWYDHVKPPVNVFPPIVSMASQNPYEMGFRVPLILISPYAVPRSIDHTYRGQAAILGHIENVFGLTSMGTADSYSAFTGAPPWGYGGSGSFVQGGTDTLAPMSNYAQSPQACYAPPAGPYLVAPGSASP
jgi:phospholipase C